MNWATTIKHQVTVVLDERAFHICVEEEDGDLMLSINNEYVRDVEALPEYEELVEIIEEELTVNKFSRVKFPGEGSVS